jgi:hypothetical protein
MQWREIPGVYRRESVKFVQFFGEARPVLRQETLSLSHILFCSAHMLLNGLYAYFNNTTKNGLKADERFSSFDNDIVFTAYISLSGFAYSHFFFFFCNIRFNFRFKFGISRFCGEQINSPVGIGPKI